MKTIDEISNDFSNGIIKFHKVMETELYQDAIEFYLQNKFSASASLCSVLYEMIFTTRLINETANPTGFIPNQDNVNEQLTNLLNKENEVININKLSFRKITKELKDIGILSQSEKDTYDDFYSKYRNPVAHGLTCRLFESSMGHPPNHTFEIDVNYNAVYKKPAEELLNMVYDLMVVKNFRKQ